MLAPPRSTASISVPRHEKFADRIDGAISTFLFSSIRFYAVLSVVRVGRARRARRSRASIIVLNGWSGIRVLSFTRVHIASWGRSVRVLCNRIDIAIDWPIGVHIDVAARIRIHIRILVRILVLITLRSVLISRNVAASTIGVLRRFHSLGCFALLCWAANIQSDSLPGLYHLSWTWQLKNDCVWFSLVSR